MLKMDIPPHFIDKIVSFATKKNQFKAYFLKTNIS